VRNGDTLTEALAGSKFFSKSFLSFIEAGEQTGSLVRLTEWLADFHEQELEAGLTGFVALAEPLIMAVMGFVTAVLLVATIKPTLLILQTI
jgi:type II secretory pathway component PulF